MRRYKVFEYSANPGVVLYPGYEIEMLPQINYSVDHKLYNKMRQGESSCFGGLSPMTCRRAKGERIFWNSQTGRG